MCTEEIIRIINNSDFRSISTFSEKAKVMFPEITNFTVIDIKDMGISGKLAVARFNVGKDDVIVKGFLYENSKWLPETHGYILAKKL